MSGAYRNLSMWSLMTPEENGQQRRHKKMSHFYNVVFIVLVLILFVGALFTVSFVVHWFNAQKIYYKTISNEISKSHTENANLFEALNASIIEKIQKMNNETWEAISNLRFEIETLAKNTSLTSNETEKLIAHLYTKFGANVRELQYMYEEHSSGIATRVENHHRIMNAQWQNKSDNMDLLQKNISKLTEQLNRLEELQKCAVQSSRQICPLNKADGNNRWDAENCGEDATISKDDGLTIYKTKAVHQYTNIRAEQPFSFNFSANSTDSDKCCARHFYFEISVKNMGSASKGLVVGLIGPDFSANSSNGLFNYYQGSYGIGSHGSFMEAGSYTHNSDGFDTGDTLGCGLLRLPNGRQFKLFYTKNGQLYGKSSMLLPSAIKPALYPIVLLEHQGATVEANFGADLERKSFKFDIGQHNDMLMED